MKEPRRGMNGSRKLPNRSGIGSEAEVGWRTLKSSPLTNSVEQVASLVSLQIRQNTNDIFSIDELPPLIDLELPLLCQGGL